MHPEVLETEEIGEAGRERGAEEDDPPNHRRNVPFHGREPAASGAVELVPRLEEFGLDHCFPWGLRVQRGDRAVQVTQWFPSLLRGLARTLRRPLLLDHRPDVLRDVVADGLSACPGQALGIEVDVASEV